MLSQGFQISNAVTKKLQDKHAVSTEEVAECFDNFDVETNKMLFDTRENHRTNPPTQWFIGQTTMGRKLKIVFIFVDNVIHIKTAYQPDDKSIEIYNKHGGI